MGFWMVMLLFITQIPPGGRNLVLVIGGLSGLGYGAATSIPWAIVADVIETDELKTGKRREGAYSGFLVFLRKFAGAAAIFLVGQVLNGAGFIESSGGSVVQPQSALDALQFLVSIVPIGLLLIAIFAAWRFPLERAEHDEIRRQLVEKRRAAQEE
jgi:GPH family glycoside/pentoside/hexuronide:cation symporter